MRECVARKADIEETVSLCFPVALVGFAFGNLLAVVIYPPLVSNFPRIFAVPFLFLSAALAAAHMLGQRQMRYANYVRLMIVLVTISFYAPVAYFFLNGILDSSPGMGVPSRVVAKAIQKRGGRVLAVDLLWYHKRIEENINVSDDIYSAVEPGDTVRVVIHPGAFSQPWYGDVLTGTSDSR